MTVFEHSSAPAWATSPRVEDLDLTGRQYRIIALGDAARAQAEAWASELATHPSVDSVMTWAARGLEQARAGLDEALVGARIGWRLAVAGPADVCLDLRARALAAGVEEDEMRFASTRTRTRAIYCPHCRRTLRAESTPGQTVTCVTCSRSLLVYHHVSRRTGAHLGFMADAERPTADAPHGRA